MEYRRLGKSGLVVSAVGLGTNNFGGRMDEEASIAVIEESIEQGITMIDTANVYGQSLSEVCVGKGIKGHRDQVILATKFGSPVAGVSNRRDASRLHIMQQVEKSLMRMDTEYIDLYQVHFPDNETPVEETLRALDDLVHQGKVRYIGCSNFAAWQTCEAIWTSRSLGLHGFISVQPLYNLLNRAIELELMPLCQEYGLGIIPYFPLASGFLTGKYRPDQPAPEGTRLAGPMGKRTLNEDNFELLSKLEKFVTERGHTILELAFDWLLAKPMVTTVIAGATSPAQVRSNVAAAEAWSLTVQEVQEVDEIAQVPIGRG